MGGETEQTPSPSVVAARAQAGAPSAQGAVDRICLPCMSKVVVEANYMDAWYTPLTNGTVRIEDPTGIVVDGSLVTEPLAAHGQQDGDAPTAPLVTMGTTPPIEVALGTTVASIVPQGGGEADAGMVALGAALTTFRDKALTDLAPYVAEWEAYGIMSIPAARTRGLSKGLVSWYEGEAGFWGGVSDLAVQQYQRANQWYADYVARQTPTEQLFLRSGVSILQATVFATSFLETAYEGVVSLFEDVQDLEEFLEIIMQALRDLASGTVDLMETALDSLKELPGEIGELFTQLIDNGQDWIERLILIASETNAFEYVFHILMAVAMNMTPNFWAEMSGVVSGFILPEILIEVILAVIAGLLGGGGIPLLAGRFATFLAKLRGLSKTIRSLNILADILEAFVDGIRALARIGQGLHDEIADLAQAGADNIARIRRQLNQYKIEIDPNTLGMNGGNIRIVRKPRIIRQTAPDVDNLDRSRIDAFNKNHEQGGRVDMAEGIGSARYEAASGNTLTQSTVEGADIFDGTIGVQLKGPLVNKRTGALLDINDNMIDGLVHSAVHDATVNTASSRLVIDTLGMTPAQRNRLATDIQNSLQNQPHLNKEIIILE